MNSKNRNCILVTASVVFISCTPLSVFAEVATKPNYKDTTKSIKAAEDNEKDEDDLAETDSAHDKHSRASFQTEKEEKKSNVLHTIKSGRLKDSNKHLD